MMKLTNYMVTDAIRYAGNYMVYVLVTECATYV